MKNLNEWLRHYAKPGYPDGRAAADFIECETDETIKAFIAELTGIKNGSFDEKSLQTLLGQQRLVRYQTSSEWAKFMLIAIAEYRRNSR